MTVVYDLSVGRVRQRLSSIQPVVNALLGWWPRERHLPAQTGQFLT